MKIAPAIAIAISVAGLAACSTWNSPKGVNTSRAQFLDEVWIAPSVQGKAASELYKTVYFTPVATGKLDRQGWWAAQSAVKQQQLDKDAKMLARSMDRSLAEAIRFDPGRRLILTSQPGPDTLIIQMAITELTPAKAYWNAAATAAGFVVPGAGLLGAAGSGSVTIEGRMLDGGSGKVIATFRDSMKDKMAVVNIDSYSWYSGSEKNLDEIAVKTARVLNSNRDEVVNQSSPLTLIAY